jgi:DNA primase
MQNQKIDPTILNEIRDIANDKIEFILSELGVNIDELTWNGSNIRGPCFIHGGNNSTAFSYSTQFKSWRCYTAKCDEGQGSVFNLVQKALKISFFESVQWISNKLNISIDNSFQLDPGTQQIYSLIKESKIKQNIKDNIIRSQRDDFKPFPISLIKDFIPSQYFLEKGFSKETLNKFKIGYCNDPNKPMYLRSYAPVLDDFGKNVIGVTGRIKYEKCEYCPHFHEQGKGCPTDNSFIRKYPKWMHFGFNSGSTLYNLWHSFDYIHKHKVVVLTEGPKDVWWLDQHGIDNSCCIFGLNITECHINKLIKSGVLKVVLALNNDERGISAMEKIVPHLNMYFKVVTIHDILNGYKDIAEIPPIDMKNKIVPFLRSITGDIICKVN